MESLVSVVMPAYNLAHVVRESVERVCTVLHLAGFRFEVIVVDDGSNDDTYLQALSATCPGGDLHVYRLPRNMGKGFALMYGFRRSRGDIIVFFDADLDVNPLQVPLLALTLEELGVDAVVTSKWHPRSRVRASPERRVLSKAFSLLTRALLGVPLRDTQTGAKAFRRRVLEAASSRLTVKRYAFDAELLTAVIANGFRVVEVPALWEIRLTSRFKFREVLKMLVDTLAVFYRHRLLGWYKVRESG